MFLVRRTLWQSQSKVQLVISDKTLAYHVVLFDGVHGQLLRTTKSFLCFGRTLVSLFGCSLAEITLF